MRSYPVSIVWAGDTWISVGPYHVNKHEMTEIEIVAMTEHEGKLYMAGNFFPRLSIWQRIKQWWKGF